MKKFIQTLIVLSSIFILFSCVKKETETIGIPTPISENTPSAAFNSESNESIKKISKDGYYTSKDDVALYISLYNKLPDNYITKDEAKKLGWEPSQKNLWKITDKKSIGGDEFYNREKKLPIKKDRKYYECDIDYNGKDRNAKRIVFSNDGLIYYTDNHYETFELLYGEP